MLEGTYGEKDGNMLKNKSNKKVKRNLWFKSCLFDASQLIVRVLEACDLLEQYLQ